MADTRRDDAVGVVMNHIAHIELMAAAKRARHLGPGDDTITREDFDQVVNRLEGMAEGLKQGRDNYEGAIAYLADRARHQAGGA